MYRASAYATKGMSAELNAELDSAGVIFHELALDPFWGLAWGLHLAGAGRVAEAQAALDGWIEAGFDEGAARWIVELLRGGLSLARGDPEEATGPLEVAVSLHPDNITRPVLARAYHEAGRLGEAEATYLQVVEHVDLGWEAQEPWVLSHYWLGRVLEDQGRTDDAREAYRRFLETWSEADEGIPVVLDARRRLEAFGG